MEDSDFMEQLLNPFVVDRLVEVYKKDEDYQNRLKEDLIYQKLSDELSDEQAEELLQYFEATNSTTVRKEMLTYIQERPACLVKNFCRKFIVSFSEV